MFHEERLPEEIERGAVGGPGFKTTINELGSGFEQRNIEWEQARGEWDFAYGILTLLDNGGDVYIDLVRSFFYARFGQAIGFRFRDWSDYELARQVIGQTDTTTSQFQVFKKYTSGGFDYDRLLFKIDPGTEQVWVNNVLISEGAGLDEYQLDDNTGVLTLGDDLVAQSGTDVEIECDFDMPVRFTTDKFDLSLLHVAGDGAASVPSLGIRELRQEEVLS